MNPSSPDSVKNDLSVSPDDSSDFGEVVIGNVDMADPPLPGDDLSHPPIHDMATKNPPPADMVLPINNCPAAQHLVINEVLANGSGTPGDEFVEIYNPCTIQAVAIAGFKLMHRSASGTTDEPIITMPAGASVAASGYFIIVGPNYSGTPPFDVHYSSAMLSGTGGGLAFKDASGKTIDSMGWGASSTNAYVVGKPATAPPDGQSMARTPDGSEANGSNALDFKTAATPTPRAKN